MHNKYLLSTPLGLLIITVLAGAFLNSTSTSATTASTATATVKVAASCALTTSGGGNYSATVPNGTSAEIAGSTMSISCNDAGGFALYAVGYSDDTVGNNNMIGSSVNIATNTSGNDSYWAMKINPTSGTTPTIENSFNNYHIVPDSHTKIASYSSSTGSGSLSVDATYKANISSTQLAGNYLGKVKYTLVHPQNEIPAQPIACDPGKICYNPNTNIVEGQMGRQTPTSAELANGVLLWAPNFKRDGFGFAGWSDSYDYENDPDANLYGPNETITAPSDISTNGLSLYAIWIPSQGSMQTDAATICSNLTQSGPNVTKTLNSISALTDERDNQVYAIAKLADGKCWMIENLRLDNAPELTSSNTHNPSLPLTNSWWYSSANNNDTIPTSNHLSTTTNPTNIAWCKTSSSNCDDQSMLATNNTTLYVNNTTSNYSASSNVYSYGNYHNWYSATAGHGTYSKFGGNTTGDICSAGWHLPTGRNASGDFGVLDIALGGTGTSSNSSTTPTGATMSLAYRSYPNNFVYSGNMAGAVIDVRNSYGVYWSASGVDNSEAYAFYFYNTFVGPGASDYKWSGKMVRCVAGV